MKFKKGDLVSYTREVGKGWGQCRRTGKLISLVVNARKTKSGTGREYKMFVVYDETGVVDKGCVFYFGKAQEKHYRLENVSD